MRNSRVTFCGAYHHITGRGLEKREIFKTVEFKEYFRNLIKIYSVKYKIRIFAYCIMNNHYHLILQNSSGKMSCFMRELNGSFASFYRFRKGDHGYVFQDRYYSTLIQDDSYLKMAIIYVLLNPFRANIIENAMNYEFSSAGQMFKKRKSDDFIDFEFVENMFVSYFNYRRLINDWKEKKMLVNKSKFGNIIGDERIEKIINALYCKRLQDTINHPNRRKKYSYTDPKLLINNFEKHNNISIRELSTFSKKNNYLKGILIVKLHEEAGMTYKQINLLEPFKNMQLKSLSPLFLRTKSKMKKI